MLDLVVFAAVVCWQLLNVDYNILPYKMFDSNLQTVVEVMANGGAHP